MQTNKSKTKLKSKYAQDSKKLNVNSVQRQQKSSTAQNRSRSIENLGHRKSIDLFFCRNRILQKTDRTELCTKNSKNRK
jgi:hypothetical protein